MSQLLRNCWLEIMPSEKANTKLCKAFVLEEGTKHHQESLRILPSTRVRCYASPNILLRHNKIPVSSKTKSPQARR